MVVALSGWLAAGAYPWAAWVTQERPAALSDSRPVGRSLVTPVFPYGSGPSRGEKARVGGIPRASDVALSGRKAAYGGYSYKSTLVSNIR